MKLTLYGALILLAGSLWAHHSTTAVFEVTKRVTVNGTLTKIDWVNPHILLSIDAKGKDNAAESWRIEGNPPSWFRRLNLGRADFAKALGQPVVVEANPAKDGSMYGWLTKITFQDKTSLEVVPEDSKGSVTAR